MNSKKVPAEVQIRIPPELYPPIDRENEVNEFRDAIRNLRNNLPGSTIFEWFGGPGVGKTTLIRLLEQVCQEESVKVPWVLFDFKLPEDNPAGYLADPSIFMEKIIKELSARGSRADLGGFKAKLKEFRSCERPEQLVKKYVEITQSGRVSRLEWLDQLNDLTYEFKDTVEKLTRPDGKIIPAAIFFDETDSIETGLVDWIEEFIFSPLAKLRTCLIVWTSLREWSWGRPEVRRRLQANPLPLFDPEQIKKQYVSIGRPQSLDLAEELFCGLHTLTHGHPFAGRVAIAQVNQWTEKGEAVDAQILEQRGPEVQEAIFSKFITDYAFRNIPPDQSTALRNLAMVRFFDKKMLSEVLKACAPDQFGKWSMESFGRMMLQLNKTQLVVWDRGTALDPDLRSLIRDYFLSRDPCRDFIKVNNVALKVYKDWLKQRVDNRNMFVLEELYHLSSLAQAGEIFDLDGDPIDPQKKLAAHLEEYKVIYGDNKDVLDDMLTRLHGDLEHDADILAHNKPLKQKLLDQITSYHQSISAGF